MSEKRMWTPQEDEILIYLREQLNLTKWSDISRKMKIQMKRKDKIFRNQKQCRDRFLSFNNRYTNYLRNKQHKSHWSRQDQFNLIQLHKQFGNKWALISSKFQGITQNFIKNQFYSRLRKSVRKINTLLQQKYQKPVNIFKLNVIFKLSNLVDLPQKTKKILPGKLIEYYRGRYINIQEYLYFLINFSLLQGEFQKMYHNPSQMNNCITKPIYIVEDMHEVFFNKLKRRKKKKQSILQRYLSMNNYSQNKKLQNESQINQKLNIFSKIITFELQKCLFYLKTRELQLDNIQKTQKQIISEKVQKQTTQNGSEKEKKLKKLQFQPIQCEQNKEEHYKEEHYKEEKSENQKQKLQQKQPACFVQEQSIVQRLLYEQSPSSISGFGQKLSCNCASYPEDNNIQKSSVSSNQNCFNQKQKSSQKWNEFFNKGFRQKMYQ